MADPLRVIIHAGFHKTGTKSMQDMLRHYRAELGAEIRIGVKEDILPLVTAARAFGSKAGLANKFALIEATVELAQKIDFADPRPLLISSEDLAGPIPGRGKTKSYPRAGLILSLIRDAFEEIAGDRGRLTFVLSTRAPASWMRSCHAQHVRHTDMTDDLQEYCARMEAKSDLGTVASNIRESLAPCPVLEFSLEESAKMRLGPVEPLLDIAGVSADLKASLAPLPPSNASVSDDILQKMLMLNKAGLPDRKLVKLKRDLLLPPHPTPQSKSQK